jgi:hypothetical protein
MTHARTICLAFLVFVFQSCSVTEQTPSDVSQKFEEGIKGNGKIVPDSQTNPSSNSPVTKPAAGAPQGIAPADGPS